MVYHTQVAAQNPGEWNFEVNREWAEEVRRKEAKEARVDRHWGQEGMGPIWDVGGGAGG